MKQLFFRGQCNRTAGPSVLAGVMDQLTDFPGSWNTHRRRYILLPLEIDLYNMMHLKPADFGR